MNPGPQVASKIIQNISVWFHPPEYLRISMGVPVGLSRHGWQDWRGN